MKGSAPGSFANQSVDRGYIRLMRQPVRVKSSLQQVESVRVRLERIEAPVILHPRGRNRSVESEICTDVENHRATLQKTSKYRKNICLHVPAKEVVHGIEQIGVDADVLARSEADQSPISACIDWPFRG